MTFLDYETATSYLSKAILLLLQCQWQGYYELSLSLTFQVLKLHTHVVIPNTLLNAILLNGHCIKDKLGGYYLHVTMSTNTCD